jgi:hypothetical protein
MAQAPAIGPPLLLEVMVVLIQCVAGGFSAGEKLEAAGSEGEVYLSSGIIPFRSTLLKLPLEILSKIITMMIDYDWL